jgi:hypothetical protein
MNNAEACHAVILAITMIGRCKGCALASPDSFAYCGFCEVHSNAA